jgi:rare lipoprotein A (peptidoglycan hydrolase)
MRWGGLALVVVVLHACSLVRPVTPPVVDGRQEGIASWYGPGFHGRRTANGEVYDQYELTAAHQTLPLGPRVMVTSLTNGRSVEGRINDRGPFVGGRVVDLSYGAARVIGMVGPGIMPVRVEVLEAPVLVASRRPIAPSPRRPEPAPEPPRLEPEVPSEAEVPSPPAPVRTLAVARSAEASGSYAVLVATLSDAGRAEHLRSRIAIKFSDAHVRRLEVGTDRYYRVRIGPYPNRDLALAQAARVNRFGYPAVITDESNP